MTHTVLFRCDAGPEHGLGHLSRCLTLAQAFAAVKQPCLFKVHAPDHILARVRNAGFDVSFCRHPVGHTDEMEPWDIPASIRTIILDSKNISHDLVARCSATAIVTCIDDEVSRDLPCHFTINNHPWASSGDYTALPDRQLLIGPGYNTVAAAYFSAASPRRFGLMISLGGEDPHNHTAWLISLLSPMIQNIPVTIIIGPAHPAAKATCELARDLIPHADIALAPASLAPFAERSHIAIGAAGTASYEFAAAGIAMALIAVEDHQMRLAQTMAREGAALMMGSHDALDAIQARDTYIRLTQSDTIRNLSASGKKLFPAPGADRIVNAITARM
ncbi:MAG: hypothetical protein VW600_12335 [Ferrovibrio sp.]